MQAHHSVHFNSQISFPELDLIPSMLMLLMFVLERNSLEERSRSSYSQNQSFHLIFFWSYLWDLDQK